MSDVSITDLIAEARGEQIMSERIARYREAACDALGGAGWEINSEDELDEALLTLAGHSSGTVESVTAPTEPEHWLFSHRQRAAEADWVMLSRIPGVTNPEGRDSFIKGFHRGVNAKDRAKEATQ